MKIGMLALVFGLLLFWCQAKEESCNIRDVLITPAQPLTPTPLASGPHPLGGLVPILECISKSGTVITGYYGFNNPSLTSITVPVGPYNEFSPGLPNQSQTVQFLPGRSRFFPLAAFTVPFDASTSLTWSLNGNQVVASSNSAICRTSWIEFEVTIVANSPPTTTQVDIATSTAIQVMGIAPEQMTTIVSPLGLGYYQMVFNVSETTNSTVTPVVAVTNLFQNNTNYAIFLNAIIGSGMAPNSVDTMATGNEVVGTDPTPDAPTTPLAPSVPSDVPIVPVVPNVSPTPSPVAGVPTPAPTAAASHLQVLSTVPVLAAAVSVAIMIFG